MLDKIVLKNGVIQNSFINGLKVKISIVQPFGDNNVRTLIPVPMEERTGICVHNTANTSPSAGDEQHASWLQNVENADEQYISPHIFIDHDSMTQVIPLTEKGYHAGNSTGNWQTIGVEICENAHLDLAEENAKLFISSWLYTYQEHLVTKHQDWSGKYCPRVILSRNGWTAFVNDILGRVNEALTSDFLFKDFPDWALNNTEAKEAWLFNYKHGYNDGELQHGDVELQNAIVMYRHCKHQHPEMF